MKVNYKSDFKIVEVLKSHLVGKPFKFVYSVGGRTKEVVYDGETIEGATFADTEHKKVLVVFDDHEFPTGVLTVNRMFDFEDDDYEDGYRHVEYNETLNVELVHGNGDTDLSFTNYVIPTIAKPIRGKDYWTATDKTAIIGEIKTALLADTAFIAAIKDAIAETDAEEGE